MIDLLKEYINKRIDLTRLEIIEKSSLSTGIVTFVLTMVVVFTFFIILFNFGIAFLIGQALNNVSYGFLIVAGFYLLIMIIVIAMRKKIITSVANNVLHFLNR
ncbi:phage holin family protein [Soonwooa sp.]|uniref:phage holin family protein n=1 Tax=Soonwooa sp. TaxID=1938592 RepID=UPI002604BA6D|nr:phage holin family protein [Soonwooa sp.]